MEFTVIRSPARVCWWIMCNGVFLETADTKAAAEHIASSLSTKYR